LVSFGVIGMRSALAADPGETPNEEQRRLDRRPPTTLLRLTVNG